MLFHPEHMCVVRACIDDDDNLKKRDFRYELSDEFLRESVNKRNDDLRKLLVM